MPLFRIVPVLPRLGPVNLVGYCGAWISSEASESVEWQSVPRGAVGHERQRRA
jgi:hypothetical protein